MKYDQEYLRTLYESQRLDEFLRLVDAGKIDDPYLRAIVSTLKRSIRNLHLNFNPITSTNIQEKNQETNLPQ